MEFDKRMESPNSCPADLERRVMEQKFAKIEAQLFLDTHPCCKEALSFYRQTCKKLEELEARWEECYVHTDENRWTYVDEPWPWQKGE